MKISILSLSLILYFSMISFGQTKDHQNPGRNGIYAEGYLIRHDFSEGFASINYERVLGKKYRTFLRIGIYPDFQSAVSFPLTISWITKPLNNHHFELGIGAIYRLEHFVDPFNPSREWFHDIPAIMIPVMYRYQQNTGFFLRAGINLFVSWPTLPSPSISAGYRF